MVQILDPLIVVVFVVLGLLVVKFAAKRERNVLLTVICITYFAALVYFTLISRSGGYSGYTEVSLIPFRAFQRSFTFDPGFLNAIKILFTEGFAAAREVVHIRSTEAIRGIVLNVLLFVPFGYLFPTVVPRLSRWWQVLLFGLALSFIIECIQMFTSLGQFDLDDLITNLIGTLIGWILWRIVLKPRKRKAEQ